MNVFDISKLVLFLLYYKNIVFSNAISCGIILIFTGIHICDIKQ